MTFALFLMFNFSTIYPFFRSISFFILYGALSFKSCIEMALNWRSARFWTDSSAPMLSNAFWYILTLMSTFLNSLGLAMAGCHVGVLLRLGPTLAIVLKSLLLAEIFLYELPSLLFSWESNEE